MPYWLDTASNPILDLSGTNITITQHSVMYRDGEYKMWINVLTGNNNYQQIAYTTSSDGIHWAMPSVLFSPIPNSWEENYNVQPNVNYFNGQYVMYYSGNSNGSCSIGLATSPDGINWTKYANNPVLTGGVGTCYGGPSVIYQNGTYTMYYHANFPNDAINVATSPDGISWIKSADSPIITASSGYNQADIPSVVVNQGLNQMWFQQSNSSGLVNIWYATQPAPTPTPTLPPVQLTVPLIHQYDLPSGIQIYDSANIWAPSSPYISSWGCAITDAAMIFQYNGILKMPDGSLVHH